MQRFIPYMALPIGMALLTFRFAQITLQIMSGKLDRLIAGHEAEEELEALKEELKDAGDAMEPKNNNNNKGS
jgi:C4-dicarboxylate transporter DctQ subunit